MKLLEYQASLPKNNTQTELIIQKKENNNRNLNDNSTLKATQLESCSSLKYLDRDVRRDGRHSLATGWASKAGIFQARYRDAIIAEHVLAIRDVRSDDIRLLTDLTIRSGCRQRIIDWSRQSWLHIEESRNRVLDGISNKAQVDERKEEYKKFLWSEKQKLMNIKTEITELERFMSMIDRHVSKANE